MRCSVQYYEWGGNQYIQRLLHIENDCRPHAELWVGAHPDLPSEAMLGKTWLPLNGLIENEPDLMLGAQTAHQFNCRLPFLFKVLSARYPLSIQAHPNGRQAREGFALENAGGIELHDRNRNYKDDSHKPELISALTEFYALCGFKPLNEIASLLNTIPEFRPLARDFKPTKKSLVALYKKIMEMPQVDVNSFLSPFVARLKAHQEKQGFSKESMEYWLIKADRVFSRESSKDRGLFSICLLNLIHLRPAEAMYLPAGELHAYMEGSGLEIMANSNNVLRGGLTRKHVDVEELLNILTFNSGKPAILSLKPGGNHSYLQLYETPAEEFELCRIGLRKDQHHTCSAEHSIHFMIIIEGTVLVSTQAGINFEFSSGQVFLVPPSIAYSICSDSDAILYQARVPEFWK